MTTLKLSCELHRYLITADGPKTFAVAALLAGAIAAVYGHTLDVPLIYDDQPQIVDNMSIRRLWPLIGSAEHPGPLNPPRDEPAAGRPIVNWSFAINYYWGGLEPTGYHAANAVIHYGAALLVFLIVRRTLRLSYFGDEFHSVAGWLATAAALLWALHPLQTEAVIYATQRSELMMALFYLGTLYCSLRYWSLLSLTPSEGQGESIISDDSTRRLRILWLLLAVLAALCGMASKETMVSAPLLVLLFERTFVAGSLARAFRRSWPLYVFLAASWILLLGLNLSGPRSNSAGFGIGPPVFVWWSTQCKVLLMYLKLAVWPWPLLIHYELPYVDTVGGALVYGLPVFLMGIGTLVLLWRNTSVGYLGTWLFAILLPTSVVPIMTEMAAERRMYLPLVALAALFVVGGYRLSRKAIGGGPRGRQGLFALNSPAITTIAASLVIAIAYGLISTHRLAAYYDETDLWRQVAQAQPENYMAHGTLGELLSRDGQWLEAIDELKISVDQRPNTEYLSFLGLAYAKTSRTQEALNTLKQADARNPKFAEWQNCLGLALNEIGVYPVAISQLEKAVKQEPAFADAHSNLGYALYKSGRKSEAMEHLKQALKLRPDVARIHNTMGSVLLREGQTQQAIEEFQHALELKKDDAEAYNNLAHVFASEDNHEKAISLFEKVVQLQPEFVAAQSDFADLLLRTGRPQDSVAHYQAALRVNPELWGVYPKLTRALNLANRADEAMATARRALALARSRGKAEIAEEIERWIAHNQKELERSTQSTPPPAQ